MHLLLGAVDSRALASRPRGFITSRTELSTGRVHRLVYGCGGLWDVAIPPVHNTRSVPPTPGERPLRQRPTQAATHLDTTSLDTEFWLKIRDNHPISRTRYLGHPEAEPPEAAAAYSSSPCNLSTVTTRSAERGAARFSPQFCTGSRLNCG